MKQKRSLGKRERKNEIWLQRNKKRGNRGKENQGLGKKNERVGGGGKSRRGNMESLTSGRAGNRKSLNS